MSGRRRLRIRSWYWAVVAAWAVFFVSIPLMLTLGRLGNFFVIFWSLVTAWAVEDMWLGAFPFLLLAPAPLLLLPFALILRSGNDAQSGDQDA